MEPGAFRAQVLAALIRAFEATDFAEALFEGGSAATGRQDEFSDLDLYVVARVEHTDAVFEFFERALGAVARIVHVWPVEPAPFPGLMQRHYLVDPAPQHFAVECCVLTHESAHQFLDRERHGESRVYLDRSGRIAPFALDRAAHATRLAQRFAQIRASWPIYRLNVDKEIARGHPLDAFGFYVGGLLQPLVELAGMRHRPERFDFGWRYVHHDLPLELQRALTQLAYVASLTDLEKNLPQIDALMMQLVREIETIPSILARAARDEPMR